MRLRHLSVSLVLTAASCALPAADIVDSLGGGGAGAMSTAGESSGNNAGHGNQTASGAGGGSSGSSTRGGEGGNAGEDEPGLAGSDTAGASSGGMSAAGAPNGGNGSGGQPGTAGSAGKGGTGAAGSAGSGTAGSSMAGAGPLCSAGDCSSVLSGMDGYANLPPNSTALAGSQYTEDTAATATPPCVINESAPPIFREKHWQLTGGGINASKSYKVDLHFYGVVECKTYRLATGAAGPATTDSTGPSTAISHNLWLAGAMEPNSDHWSTYAFTVSSSASAALPGLGDQSQVPPSTVGYVINECPGARVEDHFTYRIDFATSLVVPGHSFINYIELDSDCRRNINCGADLTTSACTGPYNVVGLSSVVPQTTAGFTQPLQSSTVRGQWWLVDVTQVTEL